MRAILVAAAMTMWATGAMAQTPEQRRVVAVRNAASIVAASIRCPRYRIDEIMLTETLSSFGLSFDDMTSGGRYADVARKRAEEIRDEIKSEDDRQRFCYNVWDVFGEGGKIGGFLKRKD
jgi:hypothetical protein